MRRKLLLHLVPRLQALEDALASLGDVMKGVQKFVVAVHLRFTKSCLPTWPKEHRMDGTELQEITCAWRHVAACREFGE